MKLHKLVRLSAAAAAMTFAWAGAASAVSLLTLTGPIPDNSVGPQSTSNPCIIAATQCQQPATMGFNNFISSGNISSYNMYSTTPTGIVLDGVQGTPYTVAQLTGAVGSSSFVVAIDVNTAKGEETLSFFEVLVNGVQAYVYNPAVPTLIGNVINNGNGFADWTLNTVNLSGFGANDTVLFHATWANASDGGESFFLVGTPAIPEPETYAMMLVGFSLLGFVARRRKQSLGNVVPA